MELDLNGRYLERDLQAIKTLFKNSKKEIVILGLVGYMTIHECRLILLDLINKNDGIVKILIANPDSNYFIERMKEENDEVGRLFGEYKQAIKELKEINFKIRSDRKKNLVVPDN